MSKSPVLKIMLLHFRPRSVPEPAFRFTFTFGLGGMAAVLVFVQLVSGLLLQFFYEPEPSRAYESIVHVMQGMALGGWIRNIHYWAANFLVLIVFLHMLRVFFTGGLYKPRRLNWIVGLLLFTFILSANFSGYLLPWDQLSYWAVTISMNMLGYIPFVGEAVQAACLPGGEVGPATLKIFYWVHTTLVPILIVCGMFYHFWRIRKAGGLVTPHADGERHPRVQVVPDLLLREAATGLGVVAVVFFVAALMDAPLGAPANPGLAPNPAKAPWYFAGAQELLMHFHPMFAVLVIPLIVVFGLVILPFIGFGALEPGIWFGSDRGKRAAVVGTAFTAASTPVLVVLSDMGSLGDLFPSFPVEISQGLIPLSIWIAVIGIFLVAARKMLSLGRHELILAFMGYVFTTWVLLTVICVFFRGEGMALTWF